MLLVELCHVPKFVFLAGVMSEFVECIFYFFIVLIAVYSCMLGYIIRGSFVHFGQCIVFCFVLARSRLKNPGLYIDLIALIVDRSAQDASEMVLSRQAVHRYPGTNES